MADNRKVHFLADLNPKEYAVIDMDSGTILGTNLQIVKLSHLSEDEEETFMDMNDAEAWDYAHDNGEHLFVEEEFVERGE